MIHISSLSYTFHVSIVNAVSVLIALGVHYFIKNRKLVIHKNENVLQSGRIVGFMTFRKRSLSFRMKRFQSLSDHPDL